MATIINNPTDAGARDNSSGAGVLIGILLAVLVVLLLLAVGLPYLRNRGTGAPAQTTSGTVPGISGSVSGSANGSVSGGTSGATQ